MVMGMVIWVSVILLSHVSVLVSLYCLSPLYLYWFQYIPQSYIIFRYWSHTDTSIGIADTDIGISIGAIPSLMEKMKEKKNRKDLHAMKQIMYDTGNLRVARWLLQRALKFESFTRPRF